MNNTYFFTGFPGFIASSLIKELFKQKKKLNHIYLLVLPEAVDQAKQTMADLSIDPNLYTILLGDITEENLKLSADEQEMLQQTVTHVFHLAAIYDLAVSKTIAEKVNIHGTKMVNKWVKKLPKLQRYVYFSTAYVSGKREGIILERELDEGQSFKNHYERTKFLAEKEVQALIPEVPTTIFRPGIVRGHSKTGETIKFDGPYFLLNMFDALKASPYIPYFGAGIAEANFVPVDYVISASTYLAHAKQAIGKTYHLTDPSPYKMREVYQMLMEEYLQQSPTAAIPLSVAKGFLTIPSIRKWLKVEREGLDYFTYKAHYDTSNASNDLKGSGIRCPNFKDTLPTMVNYYRTHKNDATKHISIS